MDVTTDAATIGVIFFFQSRASSPKQPSISPPIKTAPMNHK